MGYEKFDDKNSEVVKIGGPVVPELFVLGEKVAAPGEGSKGAMDPVVFGGLSTTRDRVGQYLSFGNRR